MAGIKKLFSAVVVAVPLLAAGQAGAQSVPPLTAEQTQAVAVAWGFNKCVREGYASPAYVAVKDAYEKARAKAEQDYQRERADYIQKQKTFNKAFDVIATRDGEDAMMDEMNRLYSDLDRTDDFAGQGILEVQIEALRNHVKDKVSAETGLVAPDYPEDADTRVTARKPEEPLAMCSKNLRRVLKTLNIHEWTFRSTLSDVLERQGSRKYNEMTGGPVIR